MFTLSSYDYDLPKKFIAQRPLDDRSASRLMILSRATGEIKHAIFSGLPGLLNPGDALVLNDAKVEPARLFGQKETGAGVEALFCEKFSPRKWRILAKCRAKLRPGDRIIFEPPGAAAVVREDLGKRGRVVELEEGTDARALFDAAGCAPLPPYIKRKNGELDEFDRARYQTVYARSGGAIAAPTAGLHFTNKLLAELDKKGLKKVFVSLKVGEGTFLPVEATDIRKHEMHPESFEVTPDAARELNECKKLGGRVVAVGTTTVRALETVWRDKGRFDAAKGSTKLFIHPPDEIKSIDALITNFHLPRSTLVMLVAAFAGRERLLAAYEAAKKEGYRFYSYGDAMLII